MTVPLRPDPRALSVLSAHRQNIIACKALPTALRTALIVACTVKRPIRTIGALATRSQCDRCTLWRQWKSINTSIPLRSLLQMFEILIWLSHSEPKAESDLRMRIVFMRIFRIKLIPGVDPLDTVVNSSLFTAWTEFLITGATIPRLEQQDDRRRGGSAII